MMKIDGLTPAEKGGETPKKTDKVTGPSFDSILKETMTSAPAGKTQAAQMAAPLMPTHFAPFKSTNPFAAEAVNQLDGVLGDLQIYLNSLANPDVPTSRLAPMVDGLMEKKDKLVSLLSHLNDPALQDLVTQTASLILSENTRIHTAKA
ncbi:MAG: hypothetical protein HZA04_04820 [Nitrospinae bacterium]|nr:hypothetical protein [Nitrospinota bacterium]